MRFYFTLFLFLIVFVFSLCFVSADPSSIYEGVGSFFRAARLYFVKACVDTAWFVLDFLPAMYVRLVEILETVSKMTASDLLYDAWYLAMRCIHSCSEWFFSLFECPRERTFLFFWSYPQTYYCQWYNDHYGRWRELSTLDQGILALIAGPSSCALLFLYAWYFMAARSVRPWEDAAHFFANLTYGYAYAGLPEFRYCREIFQTTPMPTRKAHPNHSHGECAATRATASTFLRRVIEAVHHVPWVYQLSHNDQLKGLSGLRTAFWPKDLSVAPQSDPIVPNSAVMMVDVDYYVDLPRWLAANFRPHFFYSFQPHAAGKVTPEYTYSFTDNLVSYQVTGCADPYVHPVWNFQKDTVSVTRYFIGLPVTRATYQVERRWAGGDHEVIMMLPLRQWRWWNAWLAVFFISETPLRYFELQVGEHNRLIIHSKGETALQVSTAAVGSPNSITVPSDVDEELYDTSVLGKTDLSFPTVSMILTSHEINNGPGSKTLTRFFRNKVKGGDCKATVPLLSHYQFSGPHYDPDAKNSLVAFMKPLALPACAPKVCYENEKEMIATRVTRVANAEMPLTLFMDNLITEFVQLFVPEEKAGTFGPVDMDYVSAKQKRPSQQHIIRASELDESDCPMLHAFMKKEPTLSAKAPRNITTFEGDTKVRYSMFMYTVAEYLKTFKWYAFGTTPKAIAEDIANMAYNASSVAESDGEKFDGHVSNLARLLETRILTRMFSLEYQAIVHKLHQRQHSRGARTTLGVMYDLLYTRGSGSPETSVFNSILNKFIAFVAHRLHDAEEGELPPRRAFDAPGKYGGDDGISFDLDASTLRKAAKLVGQSFASEDRHKGQSFKFLSRYYSPQVWYGSPDSACDVDRSLRGFNCTVSLARNVTPVMKLVEKCRAYSMSDMNTPIIGLFSTAVMLVAGDSFALDSPELDPMVSYNSRLPADVQYPNAVSLDDVSWMNIPPDYDIAGFNLWVQSILVSLAPQIERLKMFLECPYFDARLPAVVAPKEVVVNEVMLPTTEEKKRAPFSPCLACSGKGKPVKHTAEHCWNGLTAAEKKKRQAALLTRKN